MRKVTVNLPVPYTALIESEAMQHAGAMARKYAGEGGRVVVVTTPNVRQHWGAPVERSLAAANLNQSWLEMKDGERYKNLATLEALAEKMVAAGADRATLVFALGGGIVGDVAAFLASIYMRGVNLVQAPTTLVAMIDSALGGKTAVNLACGKNLLGTFHHPRAILVDPLVLATLPQREFRSGMAEAIKYGIIGDRALFEFIEANRLSLLRREPEPLEFLIGECLRQKAEVVAGDEREADQRRILNFGHTLGHALEAASGYKTYLHGEAVAWGMIAVIEIAVHLHKLPSDTARRLREAILAACGPLPPVTLAAETILEHAASDKKRYAGVLTFVLPTAIGKVEIVRHVPAPVILAAIERARAL